MCTLYTVKGPYKPICRDCAIYFSITVGKKVAWILWDTKRGIYFPTILEVEKVWTKLIFEDPTIHFHNSGRTSSK